jgi:diguanylate cyclase (GGDEF)-like protein
VKNRSVLFVDDEPDVLSAIKRLMIDEPYDILFSESGEEALNILKSKDVHVVVVDLKMPKMDGLSLLKEIQRFDPNIIRLVLSVLSDSDSILSATNRGKVHRYITKPWNDRELKLIVKQAVQLFNEQQEKRDLLKKLEENNILLEQKLIQCKQAEDHIKHMEYHDSLTNLPNRTTFKEILKVSHARAMRNPNYLFAILFLDIDHFKNINDSLGHLMGDQLLIEITDTLRGCIRANDTFARLGGDEFAILLDDIVHVKTVIPVIDRIFEKFHAPFYLDEREVYSSVSIGIAFSNSDYTQPDDMIRDADTALNKAKSLGRARHVVFDATMHQQVAKFLKLDTNLRRAIEREEFLLHFQPVVNTTGNNLYGFEALIRWKHPDSGLIPPMDFIPVAEETGLILSIGQWVLNEAFRQMKSWHNQFPMNPPLKISVNISSKQFLQPDFIEQVKGAILETDIEPSSICLEITESVIMEDPKKSALKMMQLRDLHIQLYIDDFGTGYSSLSYLGKFPSDALKIDKSFVNNMMNDKTNMEIVRSIKNLASNLEMSVIAEGVETEAQLLEIKKLGCEYAQGYLFSKPLDAEEAGLFIKSSLVGHESVCK